MPPLSDHPGFLGLTSHGVIAIHADWPMYPIEHGWEVALQTLGQFPRNSILRQIDDIDHVFLLVFGDPTELDDPFDTKHLHAAVWREDVSELYRQGYISGAYELTLEQWVERRRRQLANRFFTTPDGVRHPVPLPTVEDFADTEESMVLMINDVGLTVTAAGWQALDGLLAAERGALHESIRARAMPVVQIGQLDTAIREACILLEARLRQITGSTNYGQRLVAELHTRLLGSRRFLSAQLKILNGELRTVFRFVRNEYMHALQELTAVQCYAILARVSRIMAMLDQVTLILEEPSDGRSPTV